MSSNRDVLAIGRRMVSVLAAVTLGPALWASPVLADTPITSFEAVPTTNQAGGHPDLGVTFTVANRDVQNSQSPCQCEDPKDVTVHLPPGFIGSPSLLPQCSIADFSADSCPIDSQVGIAKVAVETGETQFVTPVYNMIPPPDEAGLTAFKVILFDTPTFQVVSARTESDYGLDVKTISIVHGPYPVQGLQEVLWGVPADPSHDAFRVDPQTVHGESHIGPAYGGKFCNAEGGLSTTDPNTVVQPCFYGPAHLPPIPSNSPRVPFLQAPTTCDEPLSSTLDVLSYDGGTTHATSSWPQGTGCDQLSFNPSLYIQPTTTQTDAPSGIDVNLSIPQQLSPTVPSPTELRGASVTLPEGFSINPNAADGKVACSDEEALFGTQEEAHCPEFSKIGSLKIESSALPGPLPGFVYIGRPLPGNRYRIFLVADGFATHVKLAGTITPDPVTGQLKIIFENLPQSPLTAFDMHFFGSERGVLATPTRCGTYPVTSTFTPWDAALPPQTSTQFFNLDQGPEGKPCPASSRPFAPDFTATSAGNTAGAHTPFAVELTRADGDQNLTGLNVTTPPGFSATLASVPYCPEAAIDQLHLTSYTGLTEQASSACPAASQVGTAVAAAGAGTHPLYVSGKVYLAGPYKGAPLSLVIVIPAVSGPYDLGNVAVRVALNVNETSGQVTAVSDTLPQIIEGIPLRTRYIRVDLDREGFTLNPTNCDPFSVDATVTGDEGGRADLSAPYQVANCRSLGFGPKLFFRLTGSTRRAHDPALLATIVTGQNEANFKTAQVILPSTELIDQAHIFGVCTRVQFAANQCPDSSRVGFARADTPLLDKPLEGPVYIRSSSHTLPDLVADLRGQIHIVLVGRTDSVHVHGGGRIRTTFEDLPDVPVSGFELQLFGGKRGILENANLNNLCEGTQRATVRFGGQNGRSTKSTTTINAVPCHAKASHQRQREGRHARRAQ